MCRSPRFLFFLVAGVVLSAPTEADTGKTYAERLGWGANDRVVIFHVDDAGMCHAANLGTVKAITEGLATSCSIMMPCGWVSEFAQMLREHPEIDAGLHLTFTSEWSGYRWGPLAGKSQVPGLVDKEGCFWPDVPEVMLNASADEVETEMRAQIDRAETMGIPFTHLDSHMGTLFMSPMYLQRYINVGIEKDCPVLLPGGHLQYMSEDAKFPLGLIQSIAKHVWDSGLPVIDDVLAATYDWKQADKVDKYAEALRGMKPGITEIVLHCTELTDVFPIISSSSLTRKADLDAMLDARLKQVIEEEGIILTTWRELKKRRDAVGKDEGGRMKDEG